MSIGTFKQKIINSSFYKNYSRMWPFVKPYGFRALLAVLICIPIGSLDAVIALSLKPYMDIVMVGQEIKSPWYIPFLIIGFTSTQGFLNYFATYINTWVGIKITNDLKFKLFSKMLNFETAFFDKHNSGEVIYRFNNDADAACSGLLNNLKLFVSRLFSSISLIGVLFYNSWQLSIIAVGVLGFALLPLTKLRSKIEEIMKKTVFAGANIITSYNEAYSGNRTIMAYNLQQSQHNKFRDNLNGIFSLSMSMVKKTSWLSPIMHIIVSVGIGLAIGFGSYLIVTKQITPGNFVSFITALIMLYNPIKTIGNNYKDVQFSFMAIERVFNLLGKESVIKDKQDAVVLSGVNYKIQFRNVEFEYLENVPVLKNISLEVKAGETIALVGNSGGGKTTIVNLLPRFYDVKSGSIELDGVDIRNYTLKSLRDNISVVFQDNFLFSGSIKENILLGKADATDEEIHAALKMAYLDEFVDGLELGINTQIGERGILLSGGQKQRVAIARAFIKNAPIVILDEATSALDNKAEAIVQKAIENLMQNKTVFVIAHRLSTIHNADKIAVINQGELVELGTHNELVNIPNGQYKTLYEMQFKNQKKGTLV